MNLAGKWIWAKHKNRSSYNQTIIARRRFNIGEVKKAVIRITADSFYRLSINSEWINDGPCRSWPEHYQYDVIDVTPFIKTGDNDIEIVARYYGVGTFHSIPQRGGLWVELDLDLISGKTARIVSDESWEMTDKSGWLANTPKISIQMEPAEYHDARQSSMSRSYKAVLIGDSEKVWRNLSARDVPLLTKKPFYFKSFAGGKIVTTEGVNYCLPATRLCHPQLIEANLHVTAACGMATILKNEDQCVLRLHSEGFNIAVDGKMNSSKRYTLTPGEHIILAFSDKLFAHHEKEKTLTLINSKPIRLKNPIASEKDNPWCLITFDEFSIAREDVPYSTIASEHTLIESYNRITKTLLRTVTNKKVFSKELSKRAKYLEYDKMFVEDAYCQFRHRQVISDNADESVENPCALMHDNCEYTIIKPSTRGDIELCYDLGEQNCGYFSLDLLADAGVIVDIDAVEYMDSNGTIQHTGNNRNGMRYITKRGRNVFTSIKRRAGRYVFITFRSQSSPIKIASIKLIESTYPVNYAGSFESSDDTFNKIWDISARTLKLCMEDVFTDCPLYEQTLWVGDARNESLYAYTIFGATDIAKRCINIAAQSLERFPIVGSQVPSGWDCLLPAWSFLWGISVWEYYWYTGDKAFLRNIWAAVIKNLEGAQQFIDKNGLFSGDFWNFFDWSDVDQNHETVVHNSMFMVGAIDAALKCATALGDNEYIPWLKKLRRTLSESINTLWDANKKAYPDSIYEDGTVSNSVCQHTSFLALLYDICEAKNKETALQNIIDPPNSMTRVGSPFAIQFLYETLEKIGREDAIIASIRDSYTPMLRFGATTVWESFASGTTGTGGFPTRSHCHGWSASPVYFFSSIILGLKQISAGGCDFEISPYVCGLTRASGTTVSALGQINIRWEIDGRKLYVHYYAPDGINIKFVTNDSIKDMELIAVNEKKYVPAS
jgi:alpha-L-rhamnosidase